MTVDNILVLDIETTGLNGYEKGDKVLSVGIVRLDFKTMKLYPVFYSAVWQYLDEKDRECWLFKKGHMDPEEVTNSIFGKVSAAEIIADIIEDEFVTTYNTAFDLDAFLDPWMDKVASVAKLYLRAPCIMKACTQVPEIPRTMHEDGTEWPSLLSSYAKLCEPKEIRQTHNALDDAMMAGKVLLELIRRGLYDPEREEEYA